VYEGKPCKEAEVLGTGTILNRSHSGYDLVRDTVYAATTISAISQEAGIVRAAHAKESILPERSGDYAVAAVIGKYPDAKTDKARRRERFIALSDGRTRSVAEKYRTPKAKSIW